MARRRLVLNGVGLISSTAILVACSHAALDVTEPTSPPSSAPTFSAVPATPSMIDPPRTIESHTTSTTTASATTSTSTTDPPPTTTEPPTTTTTEPAQLRRPSPLARPRGFARFEPGPSMEDVAALTGLPADPTVISRPALAVKIDNAGGGRPQWNLADADLVFEENVELTTRFIAVYHSNVPDRIGPVRSARTSDLDILPSMNRPILASSGGNYGVVLHVRGLHEYGWLSDLSAQRSGCYYRSTTRPAPHNLLLDPLCGWQSATLAGPARPVVVHDAGGRPPWPGAVDERFRVEMDGVTVTWVWDGASGRYLRRQHGDWHTDMDGRPVAADNVVVMSVVYVPSDGDERSPEAQTVGSGPVVVHRAGLAIRGTWSRADRTAMFAFTTADGLPLTLTPGTTFIELAR